MSENKSENIPLSEVLAPKTADFLESIARDIRETPTLSLFTPFIMGLFGLMIGSVLFLYFIFTPLRWLRRSVTRLFKSKTVGVD